MPEPKIYFQWQNEYLLQTIYPLRETKLRDFLVSFFEIDIWKKYRDKTPQDIPEDVKAYCIAAKQKLEQAYATYQELEAYLLDDDVTDLYQQRFPEIDLDTMVKINNIHKAFKTYYPNYHNPLKEKYFSSDRVRYCEDLRKKVQFQISEKARIVRNMGPDWPRKPDYEKEAVRLARVAVPMVEEELSKLYAFLAAYERLEKYRLDLKKRKTGKEKEKAEAAARLKNTRQQIDALSDQLAKARQSINRLSNPPAFDPLKAYFLDEQAPNAYTARYPSADPAVLVKIQDLHRIFKMYFPNYNNAVKEKYFIGQRILEFEDLYNKRRQELNDKKRASGWIDPTTPAFAANDAAIQSLQAVTLPMVAEELGKLQDLQWAFDHAAQPLQNLAALLSQGQKDCAALEEKLALLNTEESGHLASLHQLDALLNIPEKEQILAFLEPAFVTVADVVRSQVEAYKQTLSLKTHAELLEQVVCELVNHATRYPLWLHYMVIHFSGMRYQSAHGSWADPKDLLLTLRTRQIQQELRDIKEDAIEALCEQKFLCYQSAQTAAPVLDDNSDADIATPALALTTDAEWRDKITHHLKALDPSGNYYKRKALLDIRIDEEDYEIEHYTDQQTIDALEGLKGKVPDWMWNEIVKVTDLRLTEVTGANWEQVSPEDLAARYERGMGVYRDILIKWERDHLTGWREEHDLTSKLVVTRAVCNEVAEHIQHLRGITPPGGLTAKPEWYMRKEKDAQQSALPDKPYFVKPKAAGDFKSGASLFWLRWMNKQPNQWQITHPLTMPSGEELIPLVSDADNTIFSNGSAYQRSVITRTKDEFGNVIENQSIQWLRWMHEATILEVAETVDGPTVLTFETAMPTDDRRQSTIGVFKRFVPDLRYNVTASLMIGTFVGYLPEEIPPYQHLRDMLDWNHILLQDNYFTPQQIDQYWQKMKMPPEGELPFAIPVFLEETPVEIAPLLQRHHHHEWAYCYELPPDRQSIAVYQPPVQLRRGVFLAITRLNPVQVAERMYFKVTRSDMEPRAQDLYVSADEVIDIPRRGATAPLVTKNQAVLWRIYGADDNGLPLFEPYGGSLPPGTYLRKSAIHTAHPGSRAPGGAISASGGQKFYLVHTCPRFASTEGLFVQTRDVKKVTEKEYARRKLSLA